MNVTYKCNNRCTFCATGHAHAGRRRPDRQRELLVKYRKLGVTLLDFDGGEPTLNPNLFTLIALRARASATSGSTSPPTAAWRATTSSPRSSSNSG